MIPYFRESEFGKGFLETTKVVAGIILKDYLEKRGEISPTTQ